MIPDNHRHYLVFFIFISIISSSGCRSNWQKPEEVIKAMKLDESSVIADIGAGRGYFTLKFADTENFNGKVYAVEVKRHLVERIQRKADAIAPGKVVAVLGAYEDPNLPEKVDVIFVCNVYHHIDKVVDYFSNVSKYLNDKGRLIIVELDKLPWYLFALRNHQTQAEKIIEEMKDAGYHLTNERDFLPVQSFLVFEIAP